MNEALVRFTLFKTEEISLKRHQLVFLILINKDVPARQRPNSGASRQRLIKYLDAVKKP